MEITQVRLDRQRHADVKKLNLFVRSFFLQILSVPFPLFIMFLLAQTEDISEDQDKEPDEGPAPKADSQAGETAQLEGTGRAAAGVTLKAPVPLRRGMKAPRLRHAWHGYILYATSRTRAVLPSARSRDVHVTTRALSLSLELVAV